VPIDSQLRARSGCTVRSFLPRNKWRHITVGGRHSGRETAGSRQQKVDSRQQAAGSRQQAAGNRQPRTGSRQQIAGNKQQTTDNRQQTRGTCGGPSESLKGVCGFLVLPGAPHAVHGPDLGEKVISV
jgi:hypothetical protein